MARGKSYGRTTVARAKAAVLKFRSAKRAAANKARSPKKKAARKARSGNTNRAKA